jgi:hypothetical protein
MRLYAVAALIAGLLMAAPAPAQPDGSWYYCDPSHAYYPYVGSCAVPWRVVPNQSRAPQAGDSTATSPSARSAPILLAPSSTASASPSSSEPQTSTFHQGQADRAIDRCGLDHGMRCCATEARRLGRTTQDGARLSPRVEQPTDDSSVDDAAGEFERSTWHRSIGRG